MQIFVGDDKGYLQWISDPANARGFVVNSHRVPSSEYLVLHRVTCKTISKTSGKGAKWTVEFSKTCSRNLSELEVWATTLEGKLHPCGLCRPYRIPANGISNDSSETPPSQKPPPGNPASIDNEVFILGETSMLTGDYMAACRHLEEGLRIYPDHLAAWLQLGACRYMVDNYEGAIQAFLQAIRLDPQLPQTHYDLGLIYVKLDQFDKAVQCFKQAIYIDNSFTDAHYELGSAYEQLSQYEHAVEAYQHTLRLKSEETKTYLRLVRVYGRLERWQESVDILTELLRIQPNAESAHFNLGFVYFKLGYHEMAIKAFRRAIDLKPEDHEAYYCLGMAYLSSKRIEEAVKALLNTVAYKPDLAEAYERLGCAYAGMGQWKAAHAAFYRAVWLKTDFAEAQAGLERTYVYLRQEHKPAYRPCRECTFWVTKEDKQCPDCGAMYPYHDKEHMKALSNRTRKAWWQMRKANPRDSRVFSLRANESAVGQRLKELVLRGKRIAEIRSRVARESNDEKWQRIAKALDDARLVLQQQTIRYQAKLWEITLIRWQNSLEPVAADWHTLTEDECTFRLWIIAGAYDNAQWMLRHWEESQWAVSQEGQTCISRLRAGLSMCNQLRKELVAQQAMLALRSINPLDDTVPTLDTGTDRFDLFNARMAAIGEISSAFDEIESEYARLKAEDELARELGA